MNALLLSFLFLGLTAASHIIYRRLKPAKKVDAIPILVIASFWLTTLSFLLRSSHSLNASIPVFFVLAALAYIILHTTTLHQSPSHAILLSLQKRGEADEPQLLQDWSDAKLVDPRLSDLVQSGCVSLDSGRYVVTPLGKKALGFIRGYQKCLGRKVGG